MAPLVDVVLDLGPCGQLTVMALASIAVIAVYQTLFGIKYPKSLPRVGQPEGKTGFSWRVYRLYYTDCATLFKEAYENYNKKGKPVLIPGLGFRNEIVMPPSSMRWVLSQPEHVLNPGQAIIEVDQPRYSVGHDMYLTDPWQGMIVKTEMNLVLENLADVMNQELQSAFDDSLGIDTESWKELDLYAMVKTVIGRAASRFTVGEPLCQNQEYIDLNFAMIEQTILVAGLTASSPLFLQPLIGRLVGLGASSKLKRMAQMVEPEYRRRMEMLQHDHSDTEPQDHFQMMMRYAQRERPQELASLDIMTRRLFAANFGSFHQTAMQTTNMLLNILGSDAEHNTIALLRDEVARVFPKEDDGGSSTRWTKAKVAQLMRADSVARETMRLQSFGNRANFRKVMVDGLKTEDGITLPRGAVLSFLGHPAQTQEEVFDDGLTYDPFRFSRPREAAAAANQEGDAKSGKSSGANVSFVSTGPNHLPFGHGKHACPGRFLVDFELKMIVSYVLTNYDIRFPAEYKGKRPPNVWKTEAVFPPDGAKIQVKRRKV